MASYPPRVNFSVCGRFVTLSVSGSAPNFTVNTGLFFADGAFSSINGLAWTSVDFATGTQTSTFLVDSIGHRYLVQNITSNINPMSFTVYDIDGYGVGPNTSGAGTLYVASTTANYSLTGTVTSLGLAEALQQGIRSRCISEINITGGNNYYATIITTGTTPGTIISIPTTPGQLIWVESTVVGRQTSGATSSNTTYGAKLTNTFYNATGLSVVQVGTVTDVLSVIGASALSDAWSATFAVNGTFINTIVAGGTGETIIWADQVKTVVV